VAIIVEDGTNVAGANSYVSRADYIAYGAARGTTIEDSEKADQNLINAMDYLNVQCVKGEVVFITQPLPFPRWKLVDGDDEGPWTIPANIKLAQMQLALDVRNGIVLLPSRSAEPQVKREKVGPIETEFFAPAGYAPDIPLAAALLAPFQCGQGFKLKTYRV